MQQMNEWQLWNANKDIIFKKFPDSGGSSEQQIKPMEVNFVLTCGSN